MRRINEVVLIGLIVVISMKFMRDLDFVIRIIVVLIGFGICMYGVFFYGKKNE